MYYFYNRGLESVLTVNGWIKKESVEKFDYQLIAVGNSSGMTERMAKSCGKVAMLQTIIVGEQKFLSGLPKFVSIGEEKEKEVKLEDRTLLTYLERKENGNVVKISSSSLFPKKPEETLLVIEKVVEEDGSALGVEEGEGTTSSKEGKLTEEVDTEKRIYLKSHLKVTEDQFAQDLIHGTELLVGALAHAQDVSSHYARLLSEMDQQIDDLLHYVEFAPVEADVSLRVFQKLQDLRVKRRCIKDGMAISDLLLRTDMKKTIPQLVKVAERIKGMDDRSYWVKQPKDFQEVFGEEDVETVEVEQLQVVAEEEVEEVQEDVEVEDVQEYAEVEEVQEYAEVEEVQEDVEVEVIQEDEEVEEVQEYVEDEEIQEDVEVEETQEYVEVEEVQEYAEVEEVQEYAEVEEVQEYAEVEEVQEYAEVEEVQEYVEVEEIQVIEEDEDDEETFEEFLFEGFL